MKRIISTIIMVSLLTLAGIPVLTAITQGPVASAEVNDDQIKSEITKIKKMIADVEKRMAAPKPMSTAAKEKTMEMLKKATKTLEDLFKDPTYRGES